MIVSSTVNAGHLLATLDNCNIALYLEKDEGMSYFGQKLVQESCVGCSSREQTCNISTRLGQQLTDTANEYLLKTSDEKLGANYLTARPLSFDHCHSGKISRFVASSKFRLCEVPVAREFRGPRD